MTFGILWPHEVRADRHLRLFGSVIAALPIQIGLIILQSQVVILLLDVLASDLEGALLSLAIRLLLPQQLRLRVRGPRPLQWILPLRAIFELRLANSAAVARHVGDTVARLDDSQVLIGADGLLGIQLLL